MGDAYGGCPVVGVVGVPWWLCVVALSRGGSLLGGCPVVGCVGLGGCPVVFPRVVFPHVGLGGCPVVFPGVPLCSRCVPVAHVRCVRCVHQTRDFTQPQG